MSALDHKRRRRLVGVLRAGVSANAHKMKKAAPVLAEQKRTIWRNGAIRTLLVLKEFVADHRLWPATTITVACRRELRRPIHQTNRLQNSLSHLGIISGVWLALYCQ
jgi:hypothetical protein